MPLGLFEPAGPPLGGTEAEQRHRAQLLGRPRGPGGCQQPPCLLGHGREVTALPAAAHADNGEYHLRAPAPFRGYQLKGPAGESQVTFRFR